jgi:hypothetical protein
MAASSSMSSQPAGVKLSLGSTAPGMEFLDFDEVDGILQDNEAEGRRGRGRRPGVGKKGGSNVDDQRNSSKVRVAPCAIFCGEVKPLVPKQKGCECCVKDLATMRRDAKSAGKEAVKILQDAEKKGNEEKLKELHNLWLEVLLPLAAAKQFRTKVAITHAGTATQPHCSWNGEWEGGIS